MVGSSNSSESDEWGGSGVFSFRFDGLGATMTGVELVVAASDRLDLLFLEITVVAGVKRRLILLFVGVVLDILGSSR